MPIYNLPCKDGTDRDCHKYVENDIPVVGLTKRQLGEIVESGSTKIKKVQVEKSRIELSDEEKKDLSEDDEIDFKFDAETICSACGSDQTYRGGRNITAE